MRFVGDHGFCLSNVTAPCEDWGDPAVLDVLGAGVLAAVVTDRGLGAVRGVKGGRSFVGLCVIVRGIGGDIASNMYAKRPAGESVRP